MRPLHALRPQSTVRDLLRGAPPGEVRAELERLELGDLHGIEAAATRFARGALALREGRLDAAAAAFGEGADGFAAAGEAEAAALSRAEHWLARIRRGPRAIYSEAAEALDALARSHADSAITQVVARHYRATALRYAGQAEATLRVLLDALARSDGLLVERAQVLNSLGTLYVVLGAYGAARAVLEHAAELNHQIGDRVSEAISYGQLGSAALAQGEQESARRYLQKQEWFASRVGDAFGQSRALTMLGDLALDMGRPDDALALAGQARERASTVDPPLHMWIAYASRTLGRAKLELGDADAERELRRALDRFRKIGNQLGEALVEWDLARLRARQQARAADDGEQDDRWFRPAWSLATLGLTGRVAQLLADLRGHAGSDERRRAVDLALAATAQSYPHLGAAHEVELVYGHPETLADIAERRIEGHRNLGRLAALTLAPPGLVVAVLASAAVGTLQQAIPSRRSSAALVAQLPGVAVWAWPVAASSVEVARDLSSFRAAAGDDARAAVERYPEGRIVAAPLAGEVGARLDGVDLAATAVELMAAPAATLWRGTAVAWDGEAEALALMSGYAPSEAR